MITKINDIDFDGARIASAERVGSDLTITVKTLNTTMSTVVVFHSITEEKAELFKGEGEPEEITYFPPLDVIETFKEKNGKYIFSGYLNNEPWAVWDFKAINYAISYLNP